MRIQDIFPSKFVRASDLNGRTVTLTIVKAVLEEMGHGPERESKLVLYFQKATKGLICNRTIAMSIAKLYGMDTDQWIGHRINIYPTKVRAFGQTHEVIRVREEIPPAPKPAPAGPGGAPVEEASEIDDENDVTDSDEAYTERTVDPDTGEITPAPDDDLWEPDTGSARATQDQLEQLDALGKAYYNGEWTTKLPKLVEHITTGATSVAAQLSPAECERLITGIRHKQAAAVQSTNGAKPVANGTVAK